MTKRLIRLAFVAAVATAPLAAPAAQAVPPVCPTHTALTDCVADLLKSDSDFCIPTGDLEDDCHWG